MLASLMVLLLAGFVASLILPVVVGESRVVYDRLKRMEEEIRAAGFAVVKDVAALNEFDKETGLTPLMHAALHGHKDMVKSFLVAGAKADLVNARGDTALMMAVQQGHYHTAEELLKAPSCDLYQSNSLGANVLHQAVAGGLDAMVHAILYHDLDRRSNPDIHGRARAASSTPLADTALQGPSPMTALMMASQSGKAGLVRLLLRMGAAVDLQTPTGETALMFAALVGRADIVELLLAAGADAHAATAETGFTALMLAASRGHLEVVMALIEPRGAGDGGGGATSGSSGDEQQPPLAAAGAAGAGAGAGAAKAAAARPQQLQALLDATDSAGSSALDHAASASPPEAAVVRALVAAGIALGRRGAMFATPEVLALRRRALAARGAEEGGGEGEGEGEGDGGEAGGENKKIETEVLSREGEGKGGGGGGDEL